MAQVVRHVHRLSGGHDLIAARYGGIVDFAGDQVIFAFSILHIGPCHFLTIQSFDIVVSSNYKNEQ